MILNPIVVQDVSYAYLNVRIRAAQAEVINLYNYY